ncbi:uncharacterized protein LOC107813264 isoform X2 [Nicotiana tabacum]|uniref:Uncharacterized protein LOC107813264 isoform X2 n=2 Tax=Nicotiana TaxID=4085 RepID=A0A1S4BYL7_TOBAC|nr:PREDICTED: uncharacterized protein LOC104214443 isoform X2 [Nicotiana sylvestris]XP_016493996.1 PREDICTED: uncharacterized protein LOC107813264 isoform X2 [Nicotiana tabacum]
MVTLNFFYKFMRLSKERMQQRMHEKLNEQKDVMEKNITMNIIARLQHQNPDLRLDPDMLRFSERSSVEAFSAQQVVVQVNSQPSAGSNNQGIAGSDDQTHAPPSRAVRAGAGVEVEEGHVVQLEHLIELR